MFTKPLTAILKVPDFPLVAPQEMVANPNHDRAQPTSLVLDVFARFPNQPAMRPQHPAMSGDSRLVKPDKDRSLLMATDERLWQLTLAVAIARNITKRGAMRQKAELQMVRDFAEQQLAAELRRREIMFRKSFASVVRQHSGLMKSRHHVQGEWQRSRLLLSERAIQALGDSAKLLKKHLAHEAQFRNWHLDDLFSLLANGAMARLKRHGRPFAQVYDEFLWQGRKRATADHWRWRLDNNFLPSINGAIAHLHHGHGVPHALAAALLHWPEQRAKTGAFAQWHDLAHLILTPNHSVRHARGQGGLPEAIFGKLSARDKKFITKAFADWHQAHLFQPTPNHGFAPRKDVGRSLTVVVDEILGSHAREQAKASRDAAQERELYLGTVNGAWRPQGHQSHQGRSIIEVVTEKTRPHHERLARAVRQARERAAYAQKTSNGGIRPATAASGEPLPRIRGETARPTEGPAAMAPLPAAAGQALSAAKLPLEEQEHLAKRRRMRHFQRSLAMHTDTVSRLHDHVVRFASLDTVPDADQPPLTVANKVKGDPRSGS